MSRKKLNATAHSADLQWVLQPPALGARFVRPR
jgi:hypothetical protein